MDRRCFLGRAVSGAAALGMLVGTASATVGLAAAIDARPVTETGGRAGSCKVIGVGGAGYRIVMPMQFGTAFENCRVFPDFSCIDLGHEFSSHFAPPHLLSGGQFIGGPIGQPPSAPIRSTLTDRAAAMIDLTVLREAVSGADMVMLVAGLGGRAGSGLMPLMAKLARDAGALTVAAVVKPFEFEWGRYQTADETIRQLEREADVVVVFANNDLLAGEYADLPLAEGFDHMDRLITDRIASLVAAHCNVARRVCFR